MLSSGEGRERASLYFVDVTRAGQLEIWGEGSSKPANHSCSKSWTHFNLAAGGGDKAEEEAILY